MKSKDPEFICFDCGRRYGRQKHSNRTHTAHMNTCGVCGNYSLVDRIIEWAGLRGEEWKEQVRHD